MEQYTIYCTEEQTRRAWLLDAPFKYCCGKELPDHKYICTTPLLSHTEVIEVPTTQQMIGWLREEYNIQAFVSTLAGNTASVFVKNEFTMFNVNDDDEMPKRFDTYEQAELAAIDAALDYLEKGE